VQAKAKVQNELPFREDKCKKKDKLVNTLEMTMKLVMKKFKEFLNIY
jgi:hypothetical protein